MALAYDDLGQSSWREDFAGVLVMSVLGLAIGLPGLKVVTFRYRVVVDTALRQSAPAYQTVKAGRGFHRFHKTASSPLCDIHVSPSNSWAMSVSVMERAMLKNLIPFFAAAIVFVAAIAFQPPAGTSDELGTKIDFDQAFAAVPAAPTFDADVANPFQARLYRLGMKRMDAVSYAEWLNVVQYP